jgi:hypothetical protein
VMRIGSHSLREFPLDVVRINCERCGRAGSYRRDGLMVRFGADIALPDLLVVMRAPEGLLKTMRRAVHGLGRVRWLVNLGGACRVAHST